MKFFIFYIIINLNIFINNCNDKEELNLSKHNQLQQIDALSISYEISTDINIVLKVIITISNNKYKNISFKAFLKSDDGFNQYSLHCQNESFNLIICSTEKNISIVLNKKYYFHFNQKTSFSSFYFNGKEIFEDNKRVSLIFHPKIKPGQILYNNNKKFYAEIGDNMISNGFLYITKKSKKVLNKPKNGFNKYIELNNYIFRGGLSSFTLGAYKEAIKRGYKMVDADILFTKDKIPVVSHGGSLNSISNGKGKLIEKTYKELKKLDFGSKINKKYSGETILKFEDLLKLCKANNIIIDLDLYHLNYNKFFKNMREYITIIIEYIKKYDMLDSIIFNDKRQKIIENFISIRKDLSFSLNGMNEKQSIEKIKDKYEHSKILIYNMGDLQKGKTINKESVKYGLSLGKKIKAAKIDDIDFANKVLEWGVIPIIVNCTNSGFNKQLVICEIDNNTRLIDNEIYNIYYSKNLFKISEDIVEKPIGHFKYINSNSDNLQYYDINYFDFNKGVIDFKISKIINSKEKIKGLVGPSYDNVAKCYILNFICDRNDNFTIKCNIDKKDPEKVLFFGKYSIYSLEGYSFNPIRLNNKINRSMNKKLYYILIFIIFIISYYKIKIRNKKR